MAADKLVIFDDGRGAWGPMADMRATFEMRSGAVTTQQRIQRVLGRRADALIVPAALADLVAARHPNTPVNAQTLAGDCLFVNGRWLALDAIDLLRRLQPGQRLIAQGDDGRVAARGSYESIAVEIGSMPPNGHQVVRHTAPLLIDRPWHLLDHLERALRADLAASDAPPWDGRQPGVHVVGDHAVRVAADARVYPGVVFNAEQGPIVIDAVAVVGANAVLEGPCYVGERSCVVPQSLIRCNSVIGPMCKVGGEVSFSVLQGQSNKSHSGYLGHSLVGQWVNLGGDTNVSNLKNTYGSVRVQLEADDAAQDTGRVFVGPIVGDFVRTAIGSRLLTGACLGTGAMIAVCGFAPKFARRFGFLTDDGDAPYDVEKFLETAGRMMQRRDCTLGEAEAARLRQLAAQA